MTAVVVQERAGVAAAGPIRRWLGAAGPEALALLQTGEEREQLSQEASTRARSGTGEESVLRAWTDLVRSVTGMRSFLGYRSPRGERVEEVLARLRGELSALAGPDRASVIGAAALELGSLRARLFLQALPEFALDFRTPPQASSRDGRCATPLPRPDPDRFAQLLGESLPNLGRLVLRREAAELWTPWRVQCGNSGGPVLVRERGRLRVAAVTHVQHHGRRSRGNAPHIPAPVLRAYLAAVDRS